MTGFGRYMGGEVTIVTAPNGAVTNTDAVEGLAALSASEPTNVELAPGVHSIVGLSLVNHAVIEGATGLIVYDAGDSVQDGEILLEHIRTISDKPIVGLIYSHSHYAYGASALIGETDVPVVGHPNVNGIVETGAGGAIAGVFGELAPLYQARAAEQLSNYIPDEGPDATVAGKIVWKESGFVPVNREVADGEEFELDGVRMQGFTKYWSDEDACLTVYLPDHGVVLNNVFMPFMPNLYPLRGDTFRDPRTWRDGVKLIRDLQPSALHNSHGLPTVGADTIKQTLNAYMDGITFIFDQTLRGMLKGLGPDELRTFVQLPRHLREFPQLAQVYGEVPVFPPRIYVEAMGWFDRDAANIFPPPPELEAERIVAGFGGRDAVLTAVSQAIEDEEFAWAARLANHLYRLDPNDVEARALKAKSLREMGRRALGSIARSFFLSQARALEGRVEIPTVIVPGAAELSQGNIADVVNNFRVFIDPERSASVDTMLLLEFIDADDDPVLALIVRRGVCEFVPDVAESTREPDLSCSLTRLAWAKLFTGEVSARELVSSDAIDAGNDAPAVLEFLELFEPFDPLDNQSIPQHR